MSQKSNIYVIKVGTSVIVNNDGRLNYNKISELLEDISSIKHKQKKRCLLVSSGAVAAGKLGFDAANGLDHASYKQFCASIGQPKLISFYSQIATEFGFNVAQVLVTRDAFANREQYLSLRNSLLNILDRNILPIVNDNDVLHRTENGFSDNDHLASYIAAMLSAEKAIFLTSVDGLIKNYGQNNASLIKNVNQNYDELLNWITPHTTGTGGMRSKLNASKLLWDLGVDSVIANGTKTTPLKRVVEGDTECTRFAPRHGRRVSGIRRWLCSGAMPAGSIVISAEGAEKIRSLTERKSILAKGIMHVEGTFSSKDPVVVHDQSKNYLGVGIAKIGSDELREIMGSNNQIVIHADYFYGSNIHY